VEIDVFQGERDAVGMRPCAGGRFAAMEKCFLSAAENSCTLSSRDLHRQAFHSNCLWKLTFVATPGTFNIDLAISLSQSCLFG
jgi:hypothetical protein